MPSNAVRETHQKAGHVTCAEAKQILSRYNASHFRNHEKERARYSIPANPKRDDDIRLGAFIARVERLEGIARELVAGPDAFDDDLDALIDRLETELAKEVLDHG